MQKARCAAEFRPEAIKLVVERGHSIFELVQRLGVPKGVLYGWEGAGQREPPAMAWAYV